jgi:type I restriction enzyme M protein
VRDEHDAARHRLGKACRCVVGDALAADPGERFDVVLANPPFGKKSSTVIVGETAAPAPRRTPSSATTSGPPPEQAAQLRAAHQDAAGKIHGRAAVVVPDNVLFEGGAGETIRKKLLHECDVHTLLRLPTGLFYARA